VDKLGPLAINCHGVIRKHLFSLFLNFILKKLTNNYEMEQAYTYLTLASNSICSNGGSWPKASVHFSLEAILLTQDFFLKLKK
jgi:hypothetical protein